MPNPWVVISLLWEETGRQFIIRLECGLLATNDGDDSDGDDDNEDDAESADNCAAEGESFPFVN